MQEFAEFIAPKCTAKRRARTNISQGNFVPEGRAKVAVADRRALVDAAPDAVVVIDEQGKILINRQTEKLFGYSCQEYWSRR